MTVFFFNFFYVCRCVILRVLLVQRGSRGFIFLRTCAKKCAIIHVILKKLKIFTQRI